MFGEAGEGYSWRRRPQGSRRGWENKEQISSTEMRENWEHLVCTLKINGQCLAIKEFYALCSFFYLWGTKQFFFKMEVGGKAGLTWCSLKIEIRYIIHIFYLKHKLYEECELILCSTHIWPYKHSKTLRKVADTFPQSFQSFRI